MHHVPGRTTNLEIRSKKKKKTATAMVTRSNRLFYGVAAQSVNCSAYLLLLVV